jgi:hypothetical protein
MYTELFLVKYYQPTTFKGSRFKVTSTNHGSAWISYDHSAYDPFKQAVLYFAEKKRLAIEEIVEEVNLERLQRSLAESWLFIAKVTEIKQ